MPHVGCRGQPRRPGEQFALSHLLLDVDEPRRAILKPFHSIVPHRWRISGNTSSAAACVVRRKRPCTHLPNDVAALRPGYKRRRAPVRNGVGTTAWDADATTVGGYSGHRDLASLRPWTAEHGLRHADGPCRGDGSRRYPDALSRLPRMANGLLDGGCHASQNLARVACSRFACRKLQAAESAHLRGRSDALTAARAVRARGFRASGTGWGRRQGRGRVAGGRRTEAVRVRFPSARPPDDQEDDADEGDQPDQDPPARAIRVMQAADRNSQARQQ